MEGVDSSQGFMSMQNKVALNNILAKRHVYLKIKPVSLFLTIKPVCYLIFENNINVSLLVNHIVSLLIFTRIKVDQSLLFTYPSR